MIKFNNEIIKNLIIDALDKMERGIEINEVDRNELINVILKGDRDFGIKNKDTGKYYTEEELQNSVYIHIVNENNKCYIGQTSRNPEDRWGSNGIWYKGQVFYNPIKYYGWDNISHIVICYGLSQEQANEMEVALISLFKSTNREEFGYNVANGGDGAGKHSEETRKKLSEANKGEYNYWYGKQHSEETIQKMSEAKKGKYVGEKNPMYGKHHSEETKNKMSEAMKGKNHPKAKKVYCNGMIFSTVTQCSKFYKVNCRTMNYWLNEKVKRPSELYSKFIELGLRFATEEDINTYPLYIEEQNQQDQ